ncbi:uncharacterized protein K489DRAFT_122284 [Dissoconium aciculare CBS 342.82]|uniref:F-box domain-containing protein n=1 Tax=Dissoconium aciculare CBS 342.82 TaxID=1314786 RepID=A0A6J3MFB4_9PEZI|nr:uncharacterized protein K489DRAFT_122284 [Dissoconium aciculare CBS 342.82]KAF1826665.1 hypothetical protein K489DRAFT_122284 [Dissoconium aciculare CBS 342.82]
MEATCLKGLSNELFEWIVENLDLESVRNLRLVSREISHKATQRTFASFFQTTRIVLSRESLEAFARVTSGAIGSSIEHLTIVGILYEFTPLDDIIKYRRRDTPDKESELEPCETIQVDCRPTEIAQAEKDVDILRQRQSDYALLCRDGGDVSLLRESLRNMAGASGRVLKYLSLEVAVICEAAGTKLTPLEAREQKTMDSSALEHQVLQSATATFLTSVAALSSSSLMIESANIFRTRPGSLRCGLPCDALAVFERNPQKLLPFSSLRSLSISVADRLEGDLGRLEYEEDEELEAVKIVEILDDNNSSGLSKLLASCSRLEELYVSFYEEPCHFYDPQEAARKKQSHMLLQARLPSLRKLFLGGMEIQVADLTAFLAGHSASLRSVEMFLVLVYDGLWSTVMSLVAGDGFQLDDIRLTDINDEATAKIYFDGEREQPYSTISGVFKSRNAIHRWGPGARMAITHAPCDTRHRESGSHSDWRGSCADEFGRWRIVSPKVRNAPKPPSVVRSWIDGNWVERPYIFPGS